jgi:hypothetical protein
MDLVVKAARRWQTRWSLEDIVELFQQRRHEVIGLHGMSSGVDATRW